MDVGQELKSTPENGRTFLTMKFQREELLILTKTYPEPSTKYRETTCVAALTRSGEMRRIFPIPFRFMGGEEQFQKWEWISVAAKKANDDHRPESFKVDFDSHIKRIGEKIDTHHDWAQRKEWLEPHIMESFKALEPRRQTSQQTLGVLRVSRLLGLDITPVKETQWNEKELANLTREGLFDEPTEKRPLLDKLPFGFHYRYECETPNGVEAHRHKITDWEAGALYRHCMRSHGPCWQEPFRAKLEDEFRNKDLMFLMGTMHRFPDQWLIVGLIYPPKQKPSEQLSLL